MQVNFAERCTKLTYKPSIYIYIYNFHFTNVTLQGSLAKEMDFIAEKVTQGLASLALEEFKLLWNAKDDAEAMKETVYAIRATLLDAEAKETNHQVGIWLQRLKDVLYDADDLLDELSTEALKREIVTRNKMAKKVRIFFSKSNQVLFNLKMGHKMKDIRTRLHDINEDKNILGLINNPIDLAPVYKERKQTHSYVPEDEIIGREEHRDLILRYLLNPNVKSRFSVIPIVGLGGLGKTALAQLVYNHRDVQTHFELKRWVCVSDEFDVKQISEKIFGEAITKKEMEQVQKDVRELIKGKRFLVVLDDVWNESIELWNELKKLLKEGAAGSMVIVTTRSEKVGRIMGTYDPVILKGLDDKKSWRLFCGMAFDGGKEPDNMEEREIGREIVKRCAGVPLAIRCIGRLLYSQKLDGINWSYLRNSELWRMGHEENKIFAVLKLSYDNLYSHMKNCFAFCSLFPKDSLFEKQTLIRLWVSEGFIEPSNQTMRCEEDVGHDYFMSLVSRSFFQDVGRNVYGDIVTCKMHDLMHDLARSVGKNEYHVISEENEESTRNTTRHLSYELSKYNKKVPTSIHMSKQLRTMILPEKGSYVFTDRSALGLVISNLKYLRVLVLRRLDITKVPKSIGKLKHLRFIDVSHNLISQLPRVITRLHNLQTLNLSNNFIRELPRDINKLVSLRHLELENIKLTQMPRTLGQLTSLQTLTQFVLVDQEEQIRRGCAGISELGALNNLRGNLQIRGLKHFRANPQEAKSAKLQEKPRLQELALIWRPKTSFWSSHRPEVYESISEVASKDESILEGLHPHHAIKSLIIKRFCGKSLPNWIGNLSSLHNLEIHSCKYLTSLPEGLRNLRSLQRLKVYKCPLLIKRCQKITGDDWPKIAHIPSIILASNWFSRVQGNLCSTTFLFVIYIYIVFSLMI